MKFVQLAESRRRTRSRLQSRAACRILLESGSLSHLSIPEPMQEIAEEYASYRERR